MAIVVDTCSLVSLAKNYLPLDDNGSLLSFVKEKISSKEWILLDAIQKESEYTSQGIVMDKMPFLKDRSYVTKTDNVFPSSQRKFDNMVDSHFCVAVLRRTCTDEEYIAMKNEFVKSGDGRIIVYCYSLKNKSELFTELSVLTEETRNTNDGKLFKKLPLICDHLGIKVLTLPDYLKANGFRVEK